MTVRTWNLFHGNTNPPQRHAFLREMIELVTADEPDVVCLQELPLWSLARLERWSGMRVAAVVARRSRVESARLGGWLTAINHGLLRSALTGEADAILARRPFVERGSAVVSSVGLRRVVHAVRLDDGVVVANCHTRGEDQLQRVLEFVGDEEHVVLAGDFNLVPPYELPGFAGALPGSIDQVLVRGLPAGTPSAWPEERRRFGGRLLSDHAPVELTVG
jgi:endonuclease/exonuclease/phosphatase family metal-dependent hydrolase